MSSSGESADCESLARTQLLRSCDNTQTSTMFSAGRVMLRHLHRLSIPMLFGWLLCPMPLPAADESLIAHWSLDEGEGATATDSRGGRRAVVHGARWVPGREGSALEFDGRDDWLELEDLGSFPAVTVACWVKPAEAERLEWQGLVSSDAWEAGVFHVPLRDGVVDAYLHLDGARIFNAAVALGIPARELARSADSVTFCLSKGLSCPVGSVVCGSREFIARARRNRRMVGGGMRQVGILAAAGLVALETMIDRLADDHANARRLAEGLASVPGIHIDPARVQTNIIICEVADGDAEGLVKALGARGVLAAPFGGPRVRFVTHRGINAEDVETALEVVEATLKERMALR